jgi:hypothetical protein
MPLLIAFGFLGTTAQAQSNLGVFFGLGTVRDGSTNQILNPFGLGPQSTTALGGTFGKIGADILLFDGFGIGGETDFRFGKQDYAGLKLKPVFWDFNGIWAPGTGRIQPELQAGLGGVNIKFYYPASYCDQFAGCSSQNQFLESSNHFQVHFGAGVRFYATPHIFIRPQLDLHWVHNFFQFKSDWVPEYTVSVGWSFVGH